MIFFDRGKFIRNNDDFKKLCQIINNLLLTFYQMSFQNIFHYNNIDIPKF